MKNYRDKQFKKRDSHKYWKSLRQDHNDPSLYLRPVWRSKFLLEMMKGIIPKETSICELGSSVGRNLNYLYKKGYKNLQGVEIHKNSVELGKENYDVQWDVINKPIEKCIKRLNPDCYITMAVLMHIHPDSEWVFKEIAKAEWIVTIEREYDELKRIGCYDRNYSEVFSNHEQVYKGEAYLDSAVKPEESWICSRQGLYDARILRRK